MPLANRLFGWLSNAQSASAPNVTLQTQGMAGGNKLSQKQMNWMLRLLTYWVDGLQDDGSGNPSTSPTAYQTNNLNLNQLSGVYTQTQLQARWQILHQWSRVGGYSQPVWEYDAGPDALAAGSPVPGFPVQKLPQGFNVFTRVYVNPNFAYVSQQLVLPIGARYITEVDVRIKPAGTSGVRTAVPGLMPRAVVVIVDQDGTVASTAAAFDSSGSVAAYEAAHSISVPVGQGFNPATQQAF